nr:9447_t:CDS:2 [Entrophospora candida]
MASQETTKHLKFLWNASHTLLTNVPNLSAYYMQKFNQNSIEKDINLADNVKNKYCSYCGSIFLPGLNCRVRIEQ